MEISTSYVAAQAAQQFTLATRTDGSQYVKTLNGIDAAPEYIAEIIKRAHCVLTGTDDPALPNDQSYALILKAIVWIADENGDNAEEFGEAQIDDYTSERLNWLGSHPGRIALCDEEAEELGTVALLDSIAGGQAREARQIFEIVLEALRERESEMEDQLDEQSDDSAHDADR